MPPETVSNHSDNRISRSECLHLWRWGLGLGVALSVLGGPVSGCGGGDGVDGGGGSGGAGGSGTPGVCTPDNSTSPQSAVTVSEGGDGVTGQVCPRTDKDFYKITVPAGSSLLDVTAAYPGAVTKVDLELRLYESDGTTAVDKGELSDTVPDDGKSELATTFRVPKAGDYVLVVRDSKDDEADNLNSYVLRVATAKEPDAHEPNDDQASAKAPDGMPGFIASLGDVDLYKVNAAAAGALVQLQIENPAAAKVALHYALKDSKGAVIVEGDIAPSATPFVTVRPLPTAGDYFVAITYAPDAKPSRDQAVAHRVMATILEEPDAHDKGTRNDSGATATCADGSSGACAMSYSGSPLTFPQQSGIVGSVGDRDFFRVDVKSTPAVLDATVSGGGAIELALDVLVPHPGSACTVDGDCKALNVQCKEDSECELSHKCLDAGPYKFCKAGTSCRLCAAAGACVPQDAPTGPKVCAAVQISVGGPKPGDKPGMMSVATTVATAQPVFNPGPVYVVVHDFQDNQYDRAGSYKLDVKVVPEPDPYDQGATPELRNNYFNPYPTQDSDSSPNKARAKDVSAAMAAGTAVTGFISYQGDEDWFSFNHPCPKADCGIQFEWIQPGPSRVKAVFFLHDDGLSLWESWGYAGATATTALSGPVTDTFGDGDCHECSWANKEHGAKYYLQIRDFAADDWDYSSGGKYSFRMKAVTPGCPASCSELPGGKCGCFCKALNMCPEGI